MRNFRHFMLPALLLCATTHLQANTAESWSIERCTALRQQAQNRALGQDVTVQQQLQLQLQLQLQQHCTPEKFAANTTSHVMPVELQVAPLPATPQAPPQRVQHNSTLEWLGSSMLLVLIGFWLWMGRK